MHKSKVFSCLYFTYASETNCGQNKNWWITYRIFRSGNSIQDLRSYLRYRSIYSQRPVNWSQLFCIKIYTLSQLRVGDSFESTYQIELKTIEHTYWDVSGARCTRHVEPNHHQTRQSARSLYRTQWNVTSIDSTQWIIQQLKETPLTVTKLNIINLIVDESEFFVGDRNNILFI